MMSSCLLHRSYFRESGTLTKQIKEELKASSNTLFLLAGLVQLTLVEVLQRFRATDKVAPVLLEFGHAGRRVTYSAFPC
ncbi:hypothetical protein FH972_022056 [Carpinus fangiana]|uniref:Uncharacterized protein n=1 Tax=Carpinus fangiana TaxID=176857 RepID=A0A5N6KRH2_9ROSI|nr:hypothetical protein FH972_022056 [Carpinus fangiana]